MLKSPQNQPATKVRDFRRAPLWHARLDGTVYVPWHVYRNKYLEPSQKPPMQHLRVLAAGEGSFWAISVDTLKDLGLIQDHLLKVLNGAP